MTRKNYVALAKAVEMAIAGVDRESNATDAVRLLVDHMCIEMKLDNPRFNEAKFRKACGL